MSEFDNVPGSMNLEPFDISTEFVADPLIPDGTFKGLVVKAALKNDNGILEFTVQLQGNEALCCVDGITPVDGKTTRFAVWLPRKGDELIQSKFSSLTVRQDRIRSIKKFSDQMRINIGNNEDIQHAIADQEWISIPVLVQVRAKPNEGILYNYIKKMERATS